mgnify:FL=1
MSMALVSTSAENNKIALADIDTPIPEGLPQPPLWKLLAIPVRLRRVSRGGIILSDDSVDAMEWHHQLYKIAAVGQHVYEGPAYKGFDITEDQKPKVGDLWLIDPKQPRRFKFDGYTVLVINDDQLQARIDPDAVQKLSFYGVSL